MGASVPYVVYYTEMEMKQKVVYAVTADEAREQVESEATIGFCEVILVELQK